MRIPHVTARVWRLKAKGELTILRQVLGSATFRSEGHVKAGDVGGGRRRGGRATCGCCI